MRNQTTSTDVETATGFRLLMPPAVMKKVNYLLRRFKNVEWSGPAWYRILKKDGDGFPTKVRLEHFTPIHLGDGTSTELDGEELGKLLPKVYKKKPELGKCFMGLIHSHHTMGAFFSGTDKEAIHQESSKEGLYFSTVVASEKEKCVTAVGYKDQYGFSQMIEGEVSNLLKEKSEPEWRYEADKIEKKRKEAAEKRQERVKARNEKSADKKRIADANKLIREAKAQERKTQRAKKKAADDKARDLAAAERRRPARRRKQDRDSRAQKVVEGALDTFDF